MNSEINHTSIDATKITETLPTDMNSRYFFLFVKISITVLCIWTLWSQYSLISQQKKVIDKLALTIQQWEFKLDSKIKDTLKQIGGLKIKIERNRISNKTTLTNREPKQMKTILVWTPPSHDPLHHLLRGNEAFLNRKCKVQNCNIITEKGKDLTVFDIVLFNGRDVVSKKYPRLPDKRSTKQKYVFASIESADYYPICDNRFDSYFNITWTYKLNSHIFFGYVIIRNNKGKVIGPRKEMHWMRIDEMKPINRTIKRKLRFKNKLAAMFVSNCKAPSGRGQFVKKIQTELKKLGTNMTVDVYGKCGTHFCPRSKMPDCIRRIQQNYFFYLSFENSFAEDYVTEKILHPLQNYAVPVVYGTANYTRFMPEGIYLNAMELGPRELATKMLEIASNKMQYYTYFKWMNHYSFHSVEESPETIIFII